MLANSGKNATIVAQTTSATNGSPTQMMISGAMAGSGVTCSATAQGWIAACASRLADIATAIARAQDGGDEQRGEGDEQRGGQGLQQPDRIGRERADDRDLARAADRPARRRSAPPPPIAPGQQPEQGGARTFIRSASSMPRAISATRAA